MELPDSRQRKGNLQAGDEKAAKPADGATTGAAGGGDDEDAPTVRSRPDVTQKGIAMIGDLRTEALHQALADTPIEDDTLLGMVERNALPEFFLAWEVDSKSKEPRVRMTRRSELDITHPGYEIPRFRSKRKDRQTPRRAPEDSCLGRS